MFTLDQVVPWGRSFEEYQRMFALSEADLRLNILGCGDGPAGFNAGATRAGCRVVSCDPIYRWSRDDIESRIRETSGQVLEQLRLNAADYVWDDIASVEALGDLRVSAMQAFLDDFAAGTRAGRYVEAALPALPFDDGAFDLALCSHFLFLYSDHVDETFHLAAIRELCRVAREIRIFPMLSLGGKPSPFVDVALSALEASEYVVSIELVPYEFQRGGNRMMRICRPLPEGTAG